MKRIFVFVFLILCSFSKAQQTPPCWWTPEWNWMNPAFENWQYYNGSTYVDMGTPFQNPNPSGALSRIIDVEDYIQAKGWVLLSKDFGCLGNPVSNQLPFFGLYNRFTGLVRFFFYNANTGGNSTNKALFTTQWNNPQKNTSLFNVSNAYFEPNNSYPKPSDESLYPVNISDYAGGGSWYIAEFNTHFDHTTGLNSSGIEDLTKTGADYKLLFKLYQVSTSDIKLAGSFEFNTEVSSFLQSPAPTTINGSPNPAYQLFANAKKFIGKVPSEDELKKIYDQFDQQVNSLSTSVQIKSGIKDKFMATLAAFQNSRFRETLTTISSFAGPAGDIVNGAMSLLDMFVDKPTQSVVGGGPTLTFMAPTISKGTIEMQGSSVTTGNAKDMTMQLPGVNHKYQNGNTVYSGLPYYDCPFGVLSLQSEPNLSKRSVDKLLAYSYTSYSGSMTTDSEIPQIITGIHQYVNSGWSYTTYPLNTSTSVYHRALFDYYKVSDDIQIAMNDASGLNLEEIQYSLNVELEQDNAGNAIFDALKDNVSLQEPPLPDWRQYYINASHSVLNSTHFNITAFTNLSASSHSEQQYDNPILDQVKKGIYVVSEIKNGKVIKYSTPFITAEKFKGTAIRAPKGSKIILKVMARLIPVDAQYEQTPVIIVQSYELKQNGTKLETDNSSDNYYSNTCEQQIMATDGEWVLNGPYTIPGGNSVFPFAFPSVINGQRKLTTSGSVSVEATQSNVSFVMTKEIAFESETGIIASGGYTFNGLIDPYQSVGGCANGQTALQVNHYFTSCDSDPTHRIVSDGEPERKLQTELMQEQGNELKLYCYPNPNSGSFNLVFSKVISSGSIEIYNLDGVLLNRRDIEPNLSNFNLVNLGLSSGMYILHFKNENNDKRIKFTVVQ